MTETLRQKFASDPFNIACIVAAAIAVMLPVYFLGIPDGYDLGQHVRFAERYYSALMSGELFPGWSGEDNFGFGSAGIRFYPPLAYYFLAISKAVIGDWYLTIFANVVGWMIAGCIGVYYCLREHLDPKMSLLAAVMYAIVPYHLFQFYQTVLFAEFAAAGILPFCFLFAQRVAARGRAVDVVSFAAAYAALLLTHIPTSVIATMSLGVYLLFAIDRKRLAASAWRFATAFAVSLAASGFYLVRLVSEVDWVAHNSPQYYLKGYYSYKQYLFPMFLVSPEQYEGKMLWHLDSQIILTAVLLVSSLAMLAWSMLRRDGSNVVRRLLLPTCVGGIFSFFMMSALSLPIWDRVTLLQRIQFPWRWLALFSLFAVVAFVAAFSRFRETLPQFRKIAAYSVSLIILSFLLFDLTQNILQSGPLPPDKFEQKLETVHAEQGCPCWWPVWAGEAAFANRRELTVNDRSIMSSQWGEEERRFRITPGVAGATARLPLFYYPHWKAYADGKAVDTGMDENGALTVQLPAAASELTVKFEEPGKLLMARAVSVLTWICILVSLLFLFFRRSSRKLNLPLFD